MTDPSSRAAFVELDRTECERLLASQTVGRLAGINVLFDPDYTSKRIQVDLTNVDLYDALRIVGTISGTFWHPITANTIVLRIDIVFSSLNVRLLED